MSVVVQVSCRRRDFELSVDLSFSTEGVTCFFGPSGSGKTTLLRVVAGHETEARGLVRFGGEVWQDSSTGVFVPPHERGLGWVSQEVDLFQHLDVRSNILFGARRKKSRPQLLSEEEVVGWMGIEHLLARMPLELSGGQKQRVALARAILAAPRMLLLDEPMSALDMEARSEILPLLDSVRRRLSIPILYVSHSLKEVARLGDHVICLKQGEVDRQGDIHDLSTEIDFAPWQASDQGAVLEARVSARHSEDHLLEVTTRAGSLFIPGEELEIGASVRLQIFARDVSLALSPITDDSILNVLEGEVSRLEEVRPGVLLVQVQCGNLEHPVPLLARLTSRSRRRLGIERGSRVFARMKSVSLLD